MHYYKIYAVKFKNEIIYVGQTKESIDARFFKHLNNALGENGGSRVPKLYAHIRTNKNKIASYTFELLELVGIHSPFETEESKAKRNEREKYWIGVHGTKQKCNTTAGGITAQGADHYLYGKKGGCPKATAASVAARTGKPLSEEHQRKKLETYKKTMAARKPVLKPVRCKQTGKKWKDITDCADFFDVSTTTIRNRIKAEAPEAYRNKKLGSFTFEYI